MLNDTKNIIGNSNSNGSIDLIEMKKRFKLNRENDAGFLVGSSFKNVELTDDTENIGFLLFYLDLPCF